MNFLFNHLFNKATGLKRVEILFQFRKVLEFCSLGSVAQYFIHYAKLEQTNKTSGASLGIAHYR